MERLLFDSEETGLPCYEEVQGQESRAFLHLSIDTFEVWVSSQHPWNNGCSTREWHRIERAYPIPNNLTAQGYNDLMSSKRVGELVREIINGATIEWDGSNYKGYYNAEAEAASDALYLLCETLDCTDYDHLNPVCAEEYIGHLSLRELVMPGEAHEDAASRIVSNGRKELYYLSHCDVERALNRKQQDEEEEAHENL